MFDVAEEHGAVGRHRDRQRARVGSTIDHPVGRAPPVQVVDQRIRRLVQRGVELGEHDKGLVVERGVGPRPVRAGRACGRANDQGTRQAHGHLHGPGIGQSSLVDERARGRGVEDVRPARRVGDPTRVRHDCPTAQRALPAERQRGALWSRQVVMQRDGDVVALLDHDGWARELRRPGGQPVAPDRDARSVREGDRPRRGPQVTSDRPSAGPDARPPVRNRRHGHRALNGRARRRRAR